MSGTHNPTTIEEIEAQCTDAIEADNLDHLLMLDGATQKYPENCVDDSIVAKILCKTDPADISGYDMTTDSQEAISDKLGGFSGDGGAAQDDSVKASLDLAHTELETIPDMADQSESSGDLTLSATPTAAYNQAAGSAYYFPGGFVRKTSGTWAAAENVTIAVQVQIDGSNWDTIWTCTFNNGNQPAGVGVGVPHRANSALEVGIPCGFWVNASCGCRVMMSQDVEGGGWHVWDFQFLDGQ